MLEEEFEVEDEQASIMSIQKTVETIYKLIKSLYERVMRIQDNEQKIKELSSQWKNKPVYTRDKDTNLIIFDNRLTEVKVARCAEIKDASAKIQKLLKKNFLLFHNEPLMHHNLGKLDINTFLFKIQLMWN